MIFAKNTFHNMGVSIYGDYQDFENLYEALHHVVVDEDESSEYFSASIRVLGVCYEIRHALMGNRDFEFVDNGLNDEKKKRMALVAPDKNMYLKINVLWPEILFVNVALNDFLELYAKRQLNIKQSNNLYAEAKISWDRTIAQVRMFQAAVTECLRETISKGAFTRLINIMNQDYMYTNGYKTQYIDVLNDRFINMDSEHRLKNISIFAKRIAERDKEYRELESDLLEEARKRNCSILDLRVAINYPEEIIW